MDENKQRGRGDARRAGESEVRAPSPGHAPPPHPPHPHPPPPPPPHRVTNFFIDNILRPDFGRKKPDESVLRRNESSPGQPGDAGEVGQVSSTESTSTPHTGKKADTVTDDEPLKVRGESKEQCLSSDSELSQPNSSTLTQNQPMLWPAWVYCTRYSDRPSAGNTPQSSLYISNKYNSVCFFINLLNTFKKYFSSLCHVKSSRQNEFLSSYCNIALVMMRSVK